MDDLAGSWPGDERGGDDKVTAADTRSVDFLGAGGALDAHAKTQASEKTLDSLPWHGVVEDTKRADVSNFKFLPTR